MEGFNYNRKFGEPLPTLEDFAKKKQVKENIYREQASDVSKIMRKMKITKVKGNPMGIFILSFSLNCL